MPKRVKQEKANLHNCFICWDPVSASTIQQSKKRKKSAPKYSKKEILERIYSFLKLSWESCPSWDLEWEESMSFCGPCTKGLEQLISLQEKFDQIRKELEDGVDGVKRKLQESSLKVSKSKDTSSSEARVRGLRNLLAQGEEFNICVGLTAPSQSTNQLGSIKDQSLLRTSEQGIHTQEEVSGEFRVPLPLPAAQVSPQSVGISYNNAINYGIQSEESQQISDVVNIEYHHHNDNVIADNIAEARDFEGFDQLGIIQVHVEFVHNDSVACDNVAVGSTGEDISVENRGEDEDDYVVIDNRIDMDYGPPPEPLNIKDEEEDVVKLVANTEEQKKTSDIPCSPSEVPHNLNFNRTSKQNCASVSKTESSNSKNNLRKARSNEHFSPLEVTDDGKLYYEGIEICKHPDGYICGACGFSKLTGQNNIILRKMKIHIKGVHMDAYTCDTCGKKMTSYDILNQHIQRVHVAGETPCHICQKPIRGREINLEKHMWTHKSAEEKEEAVASGNAPRDIIRDWKSDQNKVHQCFTCGKVFITSTVLKRHMETHLDPDNRPKLKCTYSSCDKMFFNNLCRNQHIKRTHERHSARRYPCLICGKDFYVRRYLQNHIASKHTSKEELKITCTICNKKFTTKRLLVEHLKNHKPEEHFKFSCRICNRKYVSERAMLRHRRKLHNKLNAPHIYGDATDGGGKYVEREDIESYIGTDQEVGGKSRKNQSQLTDGSVRQKNERFEPFTETEDGELLFESYKVIKLDKGTYQCVSCGSEFKSNYDKVAAKEVKSHINGVHLGRYTCPVCNRKFPSKVILGKHKRDAHVKRNKECEICGASVPKNYSRHHSWLHMNAEEMTACINSGTRMPFTFRCLKQSLGHDIYSQTKFVCNECNEAFHSVFDLDRHCSEQHLEKFERAYRLRSVKSQLDSKEDNEKIKKSRTHRSIQKRKREIISSEDSDRDDLDYISSENGEDVQRNVSVIRRNSSKPGVVQRITKLPEPMVLLSALPSSISRSQNVQIISEKLISYVGPRGKRKLMTLDEDIDDWDSSSDSDSSFSN